MHALTVVPGDPSSAGVEEFAEPPESDGSVLVEGLLMGVCGTDAEIVRDGYGVPPAGHKRLVVGHESLGRVLEAPAEAGVSAGDLVAGVVRRPDPAPCACCAAGEWDMCLNGRYTERGIKGRDGYAATRWRADPGFLIKLDPALEDLGVLLEPTSVVAKAWEQIERIGARACSHPHTVLVAGAGPIGLLAALLGVQRGLDVHVLDRVTGGRKPELVRALGATYHSSADDALPLRPDLVVECTGVGELVLDLVEHAGPNAIVCLTGISSGTRTVSSPLSKVNKELVLGNQVVFGTVNAAYRHYQQAGRALAAADRDWLARLITRRVPRERWADALAKDDDDVKVVVDLQG